MRRKMKKIKADIPELETLRIFKEKSGWSYEKIGERMGIHPQTIVFWLTGKHKPGKLAQSVLKRFLNEYFIQ